LQRAEQVVDDALSLSDFRRVRAEVSISMYTAWVWLRWSVQVDTDNPSSDARSRRLTMIAPITRRA